MVDYFALSILTLSCLRPASTIDACFGPYVTASTLEGLHQDLQLVRPRPIDCGGLSCEFYLGASSALGTQGPLSAYGPLGTMGPIGHLLWNPTAWRLQSTKAVDWTSTAMLFGLADNPLSSAGPLSPDAYHSKLGSMNDFGKHLQGLGLWGVLGPLGPLGALGPLGPLGPTGPYNTMNLEGHHRVPVRWTAKEVRQFDLVEVLDETRVKEKLDCSFMILGLIERHGETDHYYFDCQPNQFVTIALIPEHSVDHFNMTLFSADRVTEKIASSDSMIYTNFIQLALTNDHRNGSFRVDVNLHEKYPFFISHSYRLIVTSSADLFDLHEEENAIQGPHIIKC